MLSQKTLIAKIMEGFREGFLISDVWQEFKSRELEKTKDELEIIEISQQKINERTGGFCLPHIKPEDIHVFSPQDLQELKCRLEKHYKGFEILSPDEYASSFFLFWQGQIFLVRFDTLSEFANLVIHEAIHIKSFWLVRLTIKPNNVGIDLRRLGLVINSDKRTKSGRKGYFISFNEAVIEELTKEIFKETQSAHPILIQEATPLRMAENSLQGPRKTPLIDVVILKVKIIDTREDDDCYIHMFEVKPVLFSYLKQRQRLYRLIRKISERKNIDYEAAKQEVMSVLTRALFSGQILPAIRLIDRTLGKGVFRCLGERGKLPEDI